MEEGGNRGTNQLWENPGVLVSPQFSVPLEIGEPSGEKGDQDHGVQSKIDGGRLDELR